MSLLYSNTGKFISEIENNIEPIYKILLQKPQDKQSINSFNKIIKNSIDIKKALLPISKSLEGDVLLTSSKIWMIIILIKISQSNKKQNDFLNLVNSSLTHLLNDYVEYRKFFEDQCEILFDDKLAISQINANPKFQATLRKNANHEDVKKNYIYLLLQSKKFKDVEFDLSTAKKIKKLDNSKNLYSSIKKSKEMKIFEEILESNEMIQKYSTKKEDKNMNLNDKTLSSDEEDEVNDRLNEKDMIKKKKIQSKMPTNYNKKSAKSKNKNKVKKKEKIEEITEEEEDVLSKNKKYKKKENIKENKKLKKDEKNDKDFEEIDAIINKKSHKTNKKSIKNKNETKEVDSTKLSSKSEKSNNEQNENKNKKKSNSVKKSYPLEKISNNKKKASEKKPKKEKSQKKNKKSPIKKKPNKKVKYSQITNENESISNDENSEFDDDISENFSIDKDIKNELKIYENECIVDEEADYLAALEGNDAFLDDLLNDDSKSVTAGIPASVFSTQKEKGEPVLDLEDDDYDIDF